MKFYRLFLLFIVCIMVFIAGWVIRGNYLPFEKSAIKKGSVFSHKSDNKKLLLLKKPDESLNSEKENPVQAYENLEAQDSVQKDEVVLVRDPKIKAIIDKKNFKRLEMEKQMKEKQDKYKAMNRKHLLSLPSNRWFRLNGEYSFLVNVFSEEDKTLEYVKGLRSKHPLWSFFIKVYKGGLKVYMGPFETKVKANSFIDTMPNNPVPFPSYFLEKQFI